MVLPWVTASHFLAGNREAELKPSTPTFLCIPAFPLFLNPPPLRYSTFECCLLGLLLDDNNNNNNNNIYIYIYIYKEEVGSLSSIVGGVRGPKIM